MKTTLLTTAILSFIFFSCEKEKDIIEDIKGKVAFNLKDDPRKPIRLINARTADAKDSHGPYFNILQGNTVIMENQLYSEAEEIELDPGQYTVDMWIVDQTPTKYKGMKAAEGTQTFTVTSGNTTDVAVTLIFNQMAINVYLTNMDGATVWIGPEGFTPTDADLAEVGPVPPFILYAEDEFEVVVEYQGVTKRYVAEANLSHEYNIFIENDEGEPVETGKTTFQYSIDQPEPAHLQFQW